MTPPPRAGNNRQARGLAAHRSGLSRETLAALMLRMKLYRILGTRLRTPFGEVDILAEKNGALIVVEVKSRTDEEGAGAAIHPSQRQRLQNAAQHLAARFNRGETSIRIDAFLFAQKTFPKHIKNAF